MTDNITPVGGPSKKIQIRLTTRHIDIELPEDPGLLLVSTDLRRYALSTLVNNLLKSERTIPFEFLINRQFLRGTIDEFIVANGISTETTLTLEYIRALIPPLCIASFQHDDWVSSVDISSQSSLAGEGAVYERQQSPRILSGSYDGLLRVWNMSSEVIAASEPASNGAKNTAIKSARFLTPSKLVSSGLDMVVRIWDFDDPSSPSDTGSITPALDLYGHKWGVESIAVHAPSSRILTASSDHMVGIWSTNESEGPPVSESLLPKSSIANKRLRLGKHKASRKVPQRGPLDLLQGHNSCVSSVSFDPRDCTVAYSASHDHSMKTWDLPTGNLVDTRTTGHSLLSLTVMSDVNLVACGTSSRHITLIDPRASATVVSAITLRGHTNAVVTLAIDPSSQYGLLSGSHDGTCRIWDIRSVRAGAGELIGSQIGESVYSISRQSMNEGLGSSRSEGTKVFSVAWDKIGGIISGGEDKKVQINRGEDLFSKGEK